MTIWELLRLIAANVAALAVGIVAIGASAPSWPVEFLTKDRGPLRLADWETVERYRRWGFHRIARTLPEAGSAFGGRSKRGVPDRSVSALRAHLVELRRGEWVHWLSHLALAPFAFFNPLWLWLLFALAVIAINLAFIGILRLNRLRFLAILERLPSHD